MITVVGAGVIGLTTALRLAEAGHRVRVLADRFGEETTSSVAAAVWLPYLAEPRQRVLDWSARGFAVLAELAEDPTSGVRLREGIKYGESADAPWLAVVPDAAPLPDGSGVRARVPIVDMSVHLPWLAGQARARGVRFERRHVTDLAELPLPVVNCTGHGAEALVPGERITPIRGQVVVVEQCGLDQWVARELDGTDPTYVIPREHTVVCGGTAVASDDLAPDPSVAEDLLRRCTELAPALAQARITRHRVGLRPVRDRVRLERDDGGIVHCYGHGGCGVTMAYGCADEVTGLLG